MERTVILASCPCHFRWDPAALSTFTPEWREAHEAHHSEVMEAVA